MLLLLLNIVQLVSNLATDPDDFGTSQDQVRNSACLLETLNVFVLLRELAGSSSVRNNFFAADPILFARLSKRHGRSFSNKAARSTEIALDFEIEVNFESVDHDLTSCAFKHVLNAYHRTASGVDDWQLLITFTAIQLFEADHTSTGRMRT